jgi:hypothetical protein
MQSCISVLRHLRNIFYSSYSLSGHPVLHLQHPHDRDPGGSSVLQQGRVDCAHQTGVWVVVVFYLSHAFILYLVFYQQKRFYNKRTNST